MLRAAFTCFVALALSACAGPAAESGDAAVPVPGAEDAGAPDASSLSDAASQDASGRSDASDSSDASDASDPSDAGARDAAFADAGDAGGWQLLFSEDFEQNALPARAWTPDPIPDDGPYSEAGVFFSNVSAPLAERASAAFGEAGWLTLESYSRVPATALDQLARVEVDPANGANHVLRLGSVLHTDGTIVRSTSPLPENYRLSLRVGFPQFGDGLSGLNGYTGGELAEPWWSGSAVGQNGFYWLTILDREPRPHNNTWIHHHRKVVLDSDNNYPPWTEVYDGTRFVATGEHPVMMIALDGTGAELDRTGPPFITYSARAWQRSGQIRAVDAYLSGEWYRASVERVGTHYTLEMSGRFRYGGVQTYRATIDAAARCVWHFNRNAQEDASACETTAYPAALGPSYPSWPAGQVWPDYAMFGDPHINFYEGSVLYDDVTLEVLR